MEQTSERKVGLQNLKLSSYGEWIGICFQKVLRERKIPTQQLGETDESLRANNGIRDAVQQKIVAKIAEREKGKRYIYNRR